MSLSTERLATALSDRYRLERELGQGGMATVYLAEDLKHKRRVALKVLKPELAAVLGAERFVQEITTTAALQHPHILPLFDSGTADGFLFYVMPFIDGETLRGKLDRETQLGVDEAVKITTEVADALHYAHTQGVIHRDIKPENILLHNGRPMVADFGIALAVSAAAGGRMTETGLSLGTPHYMSPEQATAEKEISARSDVYSLASVLYEMLTGTPPHTGASAQQIIMKIVTEVAQPVTVMRKSVPANVAAAVAKALEKLPADRFESAKAFAEALKNPAFRTADILGARADGGSARAPASRRALIGAAALAVLGVTAAGWAWQQRGPTVTWPDLHLTLDVGGMNADLARFAVSPDGSIFAFATDEGIALRDPGQREFRVLPGTRAGEAPSFSPDGQWIVFQVGGRLRKIAVRGGSALAVIPGDSLRAGRPHWGADGSIVFEAALRLYLIPPAGGPPRVLAGTIGAQSPRLLPDGSGILYVDQRTGSKLMLYDLATDTAMTVLEESTEGQYVEGGYIVYGHPNGGIFAVRFDLQERQASGAPIPIVNDLESNGAVAPFTVTPNGMLVYRAGLDPEYRLLVRDPQGRLDTLPVSPRMMSYAQFAPDGRALAITVGSARGTNRYIAIYDFALGTLTPFTVEGGGHAPIWSPDGRRLAFTAESEDSNAEDLFVQPVDRSGSPTHVLRIPNDQHATAWPDDTTLVFNEAGSGRQVGGSAGDILLLNLSVTDAAPEAYLAGLWSESDARVSPDGRYAAFTSNESGQPEVYVRRFPVATAGGQWKISSGGGRSARWSPDGRAILYQSLDRNTIHEVQVDPGQEFRVLSSQEVATVPGLGAAWDVDRQSGRIAMSQAVGSAPNRIVVVVNWMARLSSSAVAP